MLPDVAPTPLEWPGETVGAHFVVIGAPRTKKTHQRIARRRDGSPFILGAKTSIGWEKAAVLQLRAQLLYKRHSALQPENCFTSAGKTENRSGFPFDRPLNCRALIYRDRAVGDAVNYYQAVADALEAAGVVENDRLVVAWDGSRLLKDAKNPRIEITLTAMGPDAV